MASRIKKPISAEDHARHGAALRQAHDSMSDAWVAYANAYPQRDNHGQQAMRSLDKAIKALGEARSAAEDCLFRDHPTEATSDHYYGSAGR